MNRSVALCVLLLAATMLLAEDRPDWLRLSIGEGKLDQAIFLFGIPDSVRADLTWGDFAEHQKTPGKLRSFSLVYLPLRGKLTVLNGPLGAASSATLDFENDVLFARMWTYRGPRLSSAMSAWTSDSTLQLKQNQALLISSKRVGDLLLTVTCPTNGRSLLCVDEITAYLGPIDGKE